MADTTAQQAALAGLQPQRGKQLVGWAQRQFYGRFMHVTLSGTEHVPTGTGFLVAANHTSHLDAGLVKMALGDVGGRLAALAARDYFFANRLRRFWCENFTNLIPLERHGSFKSTLRLARATLEAGTPLLIFPEGTRSIDGKMAHFKPAIGSMAMATGKPVLPIYLSGTHAAMPKGGTLWPRQRQIGATVGPAIPAELLLELGAGLPKQAATRLATRCVELAVRALAAAQPMSPEALRAQMAEPRRAAQALAG
jgi:long-chain acyl-CoA synthetase